VDYVLSDLSTRPSWAALHGMAYCYIVIPGFDPCDQWTNNSRKNEETEPKQKQYPIVGVTGDGSKVRYCKEQYCIAPGMSGS